ncbi:MAG: HlyD family type I secretion periplasmic adaptor subunit [Alphaproteobacteria bacterium]|nr:MAG: HlyD family type I secretion periplasmic adaptor subunit [Alphaproteobacteria bacterium]
MSDIRAALARLSKTSGKNTDDLEKPAEDQATSNVHAFDRELRGNAPEDADDFTKKSRLPKGARAVQNWLKGALARFEDGETSALASQNLPAAVETGRDMALHDKRANHPVPPKPLDLRALIAKEERRGFVALAAFLGFLILWSSFAPLSSAAIAPGVISPLGSRKTIQHLEGGIIDRILIEEGSEVKVGDPLILLEDTMARASYELIATQYYTRAAQQARLLALQTGAEHITFPGWLLERARDPKVYEVLDTQRQLLATQRRAHADSKAVLSSKIDQLNEEVKGLEAQIEGQARQLELIGKEIAGVQSLVNKGLERTPRLLALQRGEAEIRSGLGANRAAVSRTLQAIGETELQLIAADTGLQNKVAEELSNVQTDLAQAGERMAASEDILNRIQITAPVSGHVVDLKVHTAGGIIGPGQPLMDIVPENEDLVIEARVSPMDIDVVHQGLEAQVHLPAYSQRNMPRIKGTVTNVSADRLIDQATGQAYFRATVAIDRETLEALGEEVTLSSGMPAEVMIVTGEQTLLGYLLGPVKKTLLHAFREG